ncbi:hypothetical protein CYMTET_55836 [Cymbomonas tetramitiformis]|uniref:Uncharacterized protein n=1 Tax=Cymbomonas tetramitiformis TaxID=36881 RepID=A0AAE0BDD6_9CHLO|nr:hypothetical protein CYMTET_55836 [Cymbomonas tetramitiformis]
MRGLEFVNNSAAVRQSANIFWHLSENETLTEPPECLGGCAARPNGTALIATNAVEFAVVNASGSVVRALEIASMAGTKVPWTAYVALDWYHNPTMLAESVSVIAQATSETGVTYLENTVSFYNESEAVYASMLAGGLPNSVLHVEFNPSSRSWNSASIKVHLAACAPGEVYEQVGTAGSCVPCSEGYLKFSNTSDECAECPEGLSCLGGSRYVLNPGFWMASVFIEANCVDPACMFEHIYECLDVGAACDSDAPRENVGGTVHIGKELLCADGYSTDTVICSGCDAGYEATGEKECARCADSAWLRWFRLALVVFLAGALLFALKKWGNLVPKLFGTVRRTRDPYLAAVLLSMLIGHFQLINQTYFIYPQEDFPGHFYSMALSSQFVNMPITYFLPVPCLLYSLGEGGTAMFEFYFTFMFYAFLPFVLCAPVLISSVLEYWSWREATRSGALQPPGQGVHLERLPTTAGPPTEKAEGDEAERHDDRDGDATPGVTRRRCVSGPDMTQVIVHSNPLSDTRLGESARQGPFAQKESELRRWGSIDHKHLHAAFSRTAQPPGKSEHGGKRVGRQSSVEMPELRLDRAAQDALWAREASGMPGCAPSEEFPGATEGVPASADSSMGRPGFAELSHGSTRSATSSDAIALKAAADPLKEMLHQQCESLNFYKAPVPMGRPGNASFRTKWYHRRGGVMGYLLVVMHPTISTHMFGIFSCEEYYLEERQFWLSTNKSVECFTPLWWGFAIMAMCVIVLYVIGVPLILGCIPLWLSKYKKMVVPGTVENTVIYVHEAKLFIWNAVLSRTASLNSLQGPLLRRQSVSDVMKHMKKETGNQVCMLAANGIDRIILEPQYVPGAAHDANVLESMLEHPRLEIITGQFLMPYKDEYCMYAAYDMIRKLMQTSFVVIIRLALGSSGESDILLVNVVNILAVAIHCYCCPFYWRLANVLQTLVLVAQGLTITAFIATRFGRVDSSSSVVGSLVLIYECVVAAAILWFAVRAFTKTNKDMLQRKLKRYRASILG